MLIFRLDAELSDWVVTIAHGIDFLEGAFEGLVHVIFENWLLSSFICTIIALTLVLIALDFFEDFSEMTGDHLIYKARRQYFENLSEQKHKQRLTEAEERYKKRRDEQRQYYEDLYRKRSGNNNPLVDYNKVYSKSSFENGVLTVRYYDKKTNELVYEKSSISDV